jgi:protein TonB
MLARYISSGLLAAVVTFGLFYLMQALILGQNAKLGKEGGSLIEFVRLKRDSELQEKKRKIPEIEEAEEPPPPPELDLSQSSAPEQTMNVMAFNVDVGVDLGEGPSLGEFASDSDIVPIVRVLPIYPLRALERGVEGWVLLEFTISAIGTVKDARVIDNHPSSIFNRAALKAVGKWKYNPKVEDGVAVERPGVRKKLTFKVEK